MNEPLPESVPRLPKAVVFDMDDTLYLEHEYVLSGFRHIAGLVAESARSSPDEIFVFLNAMAEKSEHRGRILDTLVEAYPSLGLAWSVSRLVEEYRCHIPRIGFLRGAASMLSELRRAGAHLAVITDGASQSQHRKAGALELAGRIDLLIVTDDQGIEYRKPNPYAYRRVSETFGCDPDACVYVGDNPAKDFLAPRELGWKTIRIRFPKQLHAKVEALDSVATPSIECGSIAQLRSLLMAWLSETINFNGARSLNP